MLREEEITPELYQEMKIVVEKQLEISNNDDLIEFLEDLPIRLRIKTVMYVYKEAYTIVKFLRNSSENFLTWVCPLLKQVLVNTD